MDKKIEKFKIENDKKIDKLVSMDILVSMDKKRDKVIEKAKNTSHKNK